MKHQIPLLSLVAITSLMADHNIDQNITHLNTINVVGNADFATEGMNSYTTDNMTTATGLNLSIRQTPQSVSVVSDKLIKDQNLKTIKEAMNYTPGVSVTTDTGGGSRSKFQVRGFDIDNIQEDGLASPAASSVQGTLYTAKELTDLIFYDRVEILRGIAGLTQSNANPGGTINLVRKKPTAEFRSLLSLGMDTYTSGNNAYSSTFDVSGGLNSDKTARARLIGSLRKGKSFKEEVESKKYSVGTMLGFDVGDDTTLNLGAIYQKTDETPDIYGLPAFYKGKEIEFDRSKFFGSSWDKEVFAKTNIFGEITHYFNDDWSIDFRLNHTKSDMHMKFAQLWSNTIPMLQRQKYDTSSVETNAKFGIDGKFRALNQEHDLFFNAQISRDKFEGNDKWMNPIPMIYNIHNFTANSVSEPNWDHAFRDANSELKINQKALNTGTRFNFTDDWHLLLGARFSGVEYVSKDKDNLKNNKITPYAGLTYDFAEDHSLYLSYAEIFKPQMNEKADGEFVKPVVGSNLEFGLKSEFFGGALNSSIAIFETLQKNKAIPDPTLYPSNYWIDGGKIRTRGLEAEISGKLTEKWHILSGYTRNKSVYLEDEKVNPTLSSHTKGEIANAYVPKNIFRFYTSYDFGRGLFAGIGARYQSKTGSYYKGAFAAPEQGAYTLFDGNIGYKFSKNLSVNFAVKNITDKKYFVNSMNRMNSRLNYYGEPRNFSLNFSYTY